jgi:hypothetical protein
VAGWTPSISTAPQAAEGWETLSPFAAALLDDPALRTAHKIRYQKYPALDLLQEASSQPFQHCPEALQVGLTILGSPILWPRA